MRMTEEIPVYKEQIYFDKKNKYCLLIPLYNEKERYRRQVKHMQRGNVFKKVDVVICDGNSNDGLTDGDFLRSSGHRAVLVRKGKGRYSTDLQMGYAWALSQGYEGMISVDGNNKDDVSNGIDLFISKLEEGYGYVQGSRFIKGGRGIRTPLSRYLAMKLITQPVMTYCAGFKLTDTANGFKAYSREFLQDQDVQPFRNIFYGYELIYYLPVKACRLGYKVTEVPVTRIYPKNGEVPTKVGGMKGNLYILSILWKMIWKRYEPIKKIGKAK